MKNNHLKIFSFASVLFISCLSVYSQQAVTGYDVQVDGIYYRLKGDSAIVVYDTSFIGGTGRNPSYSSRTSISIPDVIYANDKTYKVKTIGARAFFNCQVLKTINIPSSITTIGANAFEGCSVLDSVVSYIKNPFAIDESVFFKSGSIIHNQGAPSGMPSNAVLYVPSGTKSLYEKTEGWNQFKTIEEILIDGSTFTALTEEGVEMEFRIISTGEKTCEIGRLKDYRTEGDITIPSEVNSFQVTAIGDRAFSKCSNITSVKIPNTVKSIGNSAFAGCSSLSAINLSNNITTIGTDAFYGCESLRSIVIPSSVTSIGMGADYTSNPFQFCSSLEKIIVESGNTVYDSRDNCNAIIKKSGEFQDYYKDLSTLIAGCKNTIVPTSVGEIGDYAFAGNGLIHIEIPSSVEFIFSNAFYGNYVDKDEFVCHCALDPANFSYWGCTILDTSTKDGFYISNGKLLKYTGSDTVIVIPDIVTSISDYVFSGRTDITSVTIPNSVTSIGYGVFSKCSSLKTIKVPNSVTSIGDNVFNGCMSLSSVELSDNITSIGSFAFSGCNSLETIVFPESLCSIGSHAFDGCERLRSIKIPKSITNIDDGMFRKCSSLSSIIIPYAVNRIGDSVFEGCKNLSELYCYAPTCPETGKDVFLDSNISNATLYVLKTSYDLYKNTAPWSNFRNIQTLAVAIIQQDFTFTTTTVEGVQMRFRITDGTSKSAEVYGYYVSRTATLKEYFPAISREVTKATIPSSVYTNQGEFSITGISSNAFYGCKISILSIPSSISTIRYNAFEKCTNLTKVIIPNIAAWCSVKFELYNYTLYRNNNPLAIGSLYSDENTEITNLVIPDGVTAINDYTFYFCKNIASVKIPKSVAFIGKDAFQGCSSLQKIIISDIAAWCSVSFASSSDNPISQGHYLYSDDHTEITELVIPEGVTHIAPYAFYGCWNTRKFTIPDGLLSIGEDAFPFPKSTVGTTVNWWNLYFYCNTGTAGLLAIWNYLSQLTNRYDQKVINLQNAYDLQDKDTKLPAPSLSVNTTQTTATIKVSGIYDGYYYTLNNKPLETNEMSRIGLDPGYTEDLVLRVTIPNILSNNVSFICKADLKTKAISPSMELVLKSASSLSVSGTYNHGDAIITKETLAICNNMTKSEYADNSAYCSIYNPNATNRSNYYSNYYLAEGTESVEGSRASFHGLSPSTDYYIVYNVYTNSKSYPSVQYVTTDALQLTTLQPKVISPGNVVVAAESNLDDEEEKVGFEWRRTDWTDEFESNTGGAYLYEGQMEGYIRNLYTEKLWKFRPYYESNTGQRYYSDWVGIDPTNTSYFEPTVHTYAKIEVEGNAAQVRGYAMRGSDNVAQQGFMYWKQTAEVKAASGSDMNIPKDAQTMEAKGTVMEASLTGLDFESTYCYVAFVTTTEGETFYGEVQTFQTGVNPDGIGGIMAETPRGSKAKVVARYDLQGHRLSAPQRGVNLLHMSDGTVQKVLVK